MSGISLSALDQACREADERRADLLAHPTLNGIDYVEVDPADHTILRVSFVKRLPPGDPHEASDPADAYGLSTHPRRMRVDGGTRVVGIRVVSATRLADGRLELHVDRPGDYSPYTLTIDSERLDPFARSVRFSFMASCPTDVDCPRDPDCPVPEGDAPPLDYLAKDYASFRRLMLDLLPQLNPQFLERSPADLGIALIELLAYAGDHLSYFQDATATEAYLDTARRRISARRHARLVDYRMHDGRNAWTWVHFTVNAKTELPGPPTTVQLLTRLPAPLERETDPPGLFVPARRISAVAKERDPSLAAAVVFETTQPAVLDPRNNELGIHTWGNEECCLPAGATEAYLFAALDGRAERPPLGVGDFLLLEEVRGPQTGVRADALPTHRAVVRIEAVDDQAEDPLYGAQLEPDGTLRRWEAGPALPLLGVRWRRADALAFPLCLSARVDDELVERISVARGNLVLADHGLTCEEELTLQPPFRPKLKWGPLTTGCVPAGVEYDPDTARMLTARDALDCPVEDAQPVVALLETGDDAVDELWVPVPDLLDSPPFDRTFVAEVDDDGRAMLRFGDGEYGLRPETGARVRAVYRAGNGTAGNVGADALVHVSIPPAFGDREAAIDAVRNPLPARGGVDPETIAAVRRRAPEAFRARRLRAVTEGDYALAARELPEVAGAVASFRWTGSWYTVFVGVDPREPDDLVNAPDGRTALADDLAAKVQAFLETRRLAGYDLEVRPPELVPLRLVVEVCAAPGHFRADVRRAVRDALSNRILPGGRRGFFHPDNFTFGQPVHLSRLYAAVEAVEGVASAVVRVLHRYGRTPSGELESGVLPIGPWEIARLDDDPSFVEHGTLEVDVFGGKG